MIKRKDEFTKDLFVIFGIITVIGYIVVSGVFI